jgi:hypothetical protein
MTDDYEDQPTTALPRPPEEQAYPVEHGYEPAHPGYPDHPAYSGHPGEPYPTEAIPLVERTAPIGSLASFGAGPEPVGQEPGGPEPGPYGPYDPVPEREGRHGQRDGSDRHWYWVGGLVGVALLAVSGLIALIAVLLPGSDKPHATITLGNPSPSAPSVVTPSPTPPTTEPSLPSPSGAANTLRPSLPPPITATPPLPTTPPATTGPRPPPGADLVVVPDVVGLRAQEAIARLRAAGFNPQVVSAPIGRPRQANRVFLQSPRAGQQARRGSVVTIVISAQLQPR